MQHSSPSFSLGGTQKILNLSFLINLIEIPHFNKSEKDSGETAGHLLDLIYAVRSAVETEASEGKPARKSALKHAFLQIKNLKV